MKDRAMQPHEEHRPYLYMCGHCGWLNLVWGKHTRTGPRSGYWLEQYQRDRWGTLQPVQARCGRPLMEAYPTDLFWEEDARAVLHTAVGDRVRTALGLPDSHGPFCKALLFRSPRLLTRELAKALEATERLTGATGVITMVRHAHKAIPVPPDAGNRYAGMTPVVLPVWQSRRSVPRAARPDTYEARRR